MERQKISDDASVQRMRKDGTYGENLCLQACASLINIGIEVHRPDGHNNFISSHVRMAPCLFPFAFCYCLEMCQHYTSKSCEYPELLTLYDITCQVYEDVDSAPNEVIHLLYTGEVHYDSILGKSSSPSQFIAAVSSGLF